MPAKGASDILPGECCGRMKRRERASREDCPPVAGQAPIQGWARICALEMVEGRRTVPLLGGGRPPALRPWFARGRGEPRRR